MAPAVHERLALTLRFAGDRPRDLDAVLRSFDPELRLSSWTAERASMRTPFGRGGIDDHDYEILAWLRRCDREVLSPLFHAHGLVEVGIRLA